VGCTKKNVGVQEETALIVRDWSVSFYLFKNNKSDIFKLKIIE